MKIKLLLLLLLVPNLMHAQGFGTSGSTWNHCILPIFEGPPLRYDNVIVESVEDISLNGLAGNTLHLTKSTYYGFPTQSEINVFRDGKKVFYEEDDSLYLLYDFSLNKGDTYQVRYPVKFDKRDIENAEWFEPYIDIRIDSVEFLTIGNSILKKQYISTDSDLFKIGNYALENVGYEYWLLPFYNCDACETYNFDGLIEYNDATVNIKSDDHQCAQLKNNDLPQPYVILYPNPTNNLVTISGSKENIIQEITLYNSFGKRVLTQLQNFKDIDVSTLEQGIYIVSIKFDGKVLNQKLSIAR